MARPHITPREHARQFELHELFFSTTDSKGIIRSGNDVFARVAGYASVAELIGQPHNVIRHPDMPRVVFKLFWDHLKAGQPFAGYVKNIATDGSYYWVMALAVPTKDGYVSIRFKPTSPYFAKVKAIYAELLAQEQAALLNEETRAASLPRAESQLNKMLAAEGFTSYAEFMRAALATEMESRRQQLRKLAGHSVEKSPYGAPFSGVGRANDSYLLHTLQTCEMIAGQLDELCQHAMGFLQLIEQLNTKSDFLQKLAHRIHFISLNGIISSANLGRAGATLGVVTQNLATIAQDSKAIITSMTDQVKVTSPLRETAFVTTIAKLQLEMAIYFANELLQTLGTENQAAEREEALRADLQVLIESFARSTTLMLQSLPQAQASLSLRVELNAQFNRILQALSITRVAGKVQAVQVNGGDRFREFFDQINEQLSLARTELGALDSSIPYLQEQLPRFLRTGQAVQSTLARLN